MGLAAAAAVGLPAIARTRVLRIGAVGGRLGVGLAGTLHAAFSAATGIAVVPAGAAADVALLPRPALLRAAHGGALLPIDPAAVPAARALDPWFLAGARGAIAGIATMAWLTGLAAAPGRIPPARWSALWTDPGLAGAVVLPDDPESGILDIVAASFFGGPAMLSDPAGVEAAIARMATLSPRVGLWSRDAAVAERALADPAGGMAAGILRHEPLGDTPTAVPAEGAPMACAFWCLPAGCADRGAAHAFLDFAADPATQGLLARRLGLLPVADFTAAGLDAESFAALASDRAFRPNFEAYDRHHALIAARWAAMRMRHGGRPGFALSPGVRFHVRFGPAAAGA